MELLIELLFDLILDRSIEISKNKKISKWIRYPIIFLIILIFTVVLLGLFILGITLINKNIYVSLLIIILSIILTILGIIKFKKIYLEKIK